MRRSGQVRRLPWWAPGPTPVRPRPPLTLSETVPSPPLQRSCRFLPDLARGQRLVHAPVSPCGASRVCGMNWKGSHLHRGTPSTRPDSRGTCAAATPKQEEAAPVGLLDPRVPAPSAGLAGARPDAAPSGSGKDDQPSTRVATRAQGARSSRLPLARGPRFSRTELALSTPRGRGRCFSFILCSFKHGKISLTLSV